MPGTKKSQRKAKNRPKLGKRVLAGPDELPCGAPLGLNSREAQDPYKRSRVGKCRRPAGFGTDHRGVGNCLLHENKHHSAMTGAPKQLRALTEEPVDVEPVQALLWCVALTAHEIKWLDEQIVAASAKGAGPYARPSTLEVEEKPVPQGGGVSELQQAKKKTAHPVEAHILLRDRRNAVERLARYSKMAIEAGISERIVAMAERMADLVAPLLKGIFEDAELALTKKQQKALPEVTRRHLSVIEGRVS